MSPKQVVYHPWFIYNRLTYLLFRHNSRVTSNLLFCRCRVSVCQHTKRSCSWYFDILTKKGCTDKTSVKVCPRPTVSVETLFVNLRVPLVTPTNTRINKTSLRELKEQKNMHPTVQHPPLTTETKVGISIRHNMSTLVQWLCPDQRNHWTLEININFNDSSPFWTIVVKTQKESLPREKLGVGSDSCTEGLTVPDSRVETTLLTVKNGRGS